MDEKQPNELGKALRQWWDSDTFKQIEKEEKESKERAIGKYFMLSEEDKLDMIQAICYIMCKAESEGCSHRSLMDALGIYPSGFWISELVIVHNALWSYYHDQKAEKELKDDLNALEDFMKKD